MYIRLRLTFSPLPSTHHLFRVRKISGLDLDTDTAYPDL
jgi:hypothetical protein